MADSARDTIYQAIASIRLIDPHTHINPHRPASSTLADLLGYHYYTELAHSAGMAKEAIEEPGIEPRELVGRLVHNLSPIENTSQYSWLVAICRKFFDFDGDRIDASNWEAVYDAAESRMESADWPQTVLDQSNVQAVFLTNDFDDSLAGFDTETYIPCLRTDDLVFHLAKLPTQQRLAACSGIELDGSLSTLRQSLRQRFEHFVSNGARACAISLPPGFEPKPVSDGRAETALDSVLRNGPLADATHQAALSRRVFWTLAELCDEFGIPFDLMIGVNRGVYAGGVYQGQDLYDSRVSLIQYRELFNAFPNVKFPISVLASVTNQELVSYAWIFPNVITNGHWWYSNTPSFISRDTTARLEAVPRTKQIAYYSDAYKLEFVWPKFDMYRRVLAGILADHFVDQNGWSEERAIELGQQVLRDNVDAIFPKPELTSVASDDHDAQAEPTWQAAQLGGMETTEAISGESLEAALPTDPLPSEDEIDSVEIADVELRAQGLESTGLDHESIDREVEEEPLDVGDLFGEDEATPSIRMLRGEQSFSTDEESLRLTPDPVTGELIFNPSESEEAEPDEPGDVDASTRREDPESSESEDKRL
jgi:glucuronate isomerase